MLSGNVPFHAKTATESATDIIARIRMAEFSFKDSVWDSVSDLAKDLITGILTFWKIIVMFLFIHFVLEF